MNLKLPTLFLALCLTVTGCAAQLSEINKPIGPKPPNAEAKARAFAMAIVKPSLKDPESARVESISSAHFGTCKNVFGPSRQGWYVALTINARNSFGGYAGAEPYYVWFENGRPVDLTSPLNPCAVFIPGE